MSGDKKLLNTQAEVWEALLKGETIIFPFGMIFYKIIDGKLCSANEAEFENNDWDNDDEAFVNCSNGDHEIFDGVIPKVNIIKRSLESLSNEICEDAFDQVEIIINHLVERIEALESK